MAGAEAENSQSNEPIPVAVSTATLYVDKASGVHRIAFDKKIREDPNYPYADGDVLRVVVMSDGEMRLKKLADTV